MEGQMAHSLDCCYRKPAHLVTIKPYPNEPEEPGTRYGLVRCTPERPDGCCSVNEAEYVTLEEAQRNADWYNANPSRITVGMESTEAWLRSEEHTSELQSQSNL